jgi:spermidine dehydrogenase
MAGAAQPPPLTRRDFLDGVALALGAPFSAAAAASAADPPTQTGLQGQTDAAMAVGHAWRDDPMRWRRAPAKGEEGVEDLVVVGAGISGLAGAWIFRRHAGRPVRVLLLDALDDFGGHAKRNEFVSRSGRHLVGYGGSQSLDSPGLFSPAVHTLLRDLGIELKRFETEFFDAGWQRHHGVTGRGLYFDRDPWGADRLVVRKAGDKPQAWVPRTPLTPRARADLLRLLTQRRDTMPGLSAEAKRARLAAMTYRDFLARHWQIDADVIRFFEADTLGYFGVGIDATSALDASAAGLPGFAGLHLGQVVDARMSPSGRQLMASQDEYIYHFPDGNAGIARALVRGLIPSALPGSSMESLADARLDYARLDEAAEPVRVRLRATVVGLAHLGPPGAAQLVELRYVDASGTLHAVRARQVLLACWHRVIARLTDELPAAQRAALADQVKVPLVYANVLLSNWQPWQRAGIHALQPVAGFWDEAALDFPVSMGSVRCSAAPDQPILLHLAKVVVPGDGRPAREQAAAGRAMLAAWTFADFESQIRQLLQRAMGPQGLDAERDIEAITVNRWAHGYAYEYMRPWDAYWPRGDLPCMTARRGWGRVAIANADAGAYAYAHSAIDQATRAVQELLPQAKLPAWTPFPGPDPRRIGLG